MLLKGKEHNKTRAKVQRVSSETNWIWKRKRSSFDLIELLHRIEPRIRLLSEANLFDVCKFWSDKTTTKTGGLFLISPPRSWFVNNKCCATASILLYHFEKNQPKSRRRCRCSGFFIKSPRWLTCNTRTSNNRTRPLRNRATFWLTLIVIYCYRRWRQEIDC